MKKFILLIIAVGILLPLEALAWKDLDYSHSENWVICEKSVDKNKEVDLFYVLPTIFSDKNQAYMSWDNNAKVQKTAQMIAAQNCGIFAGYSRVFAPYYRQAEFRRALKEISLPVTKQTFVQHGIADVKNAFRYYLKHLNQGRPFILLGFSQGAMALLEVMKTELADPRVNAKLVAAYLIGYPRMPKNFPDYPHLRTAKRADDTGVIISFNSQSPGQVKSVFTGGDFYCINPINWRTDSTIAEKTEHLGSRFFDRKTGKPTDRKNFVSAQVDLKSGGLIVIPSAPGKYDSRTLGQGVYHMYDMNFFYHDLAANGKLRIGAFWK